MTAAANWIISVHNTSDRQTEIFCTFGRDVDIAFAIMIMVKDAKKDHADTWDKNLSTKNINEILGRKNENELHALAVFENHYIDFTARRLDEIEKL